VDAPAPFVRETLIESGIHGQRRAAKGERLAPELKHDRIGLDAFVGWIDRFHRLWHRQADQKGLEVVGAGREADGCDRACSSECEGPEQRMSRHCRLQVCDPTGSGLHLSRR
jgi:hypothetical protein